MKSDVSNMMRYPSFSLVAEIGGFVGMILGISLMDLEQFLQKVFGVVSNQFNKRK